MCVVIEEGLSETNKSRGQTIICKGKLKEGIMRELASNKRLEAEGKKRASVLLTWFRFKSTGPTNAYHIFSPIHYFLKGVHFHFLQTFPPSPLIALIKSPFLGEILLLKCKLP